MSSPGTNLTDRTGHGGATWATKTMLGELSRKLSPYSPDGSVKLTFTRAGVAMQAAAGGFGDIPFQGSIHEDGDKIVIGSARADADYPFNDRITIGLDFLEKTAVETSAILQSASTPTLDNSEFIYYEITKVGAVITATLETSLTYPVQTHGVVMIVLGRADWSGDAETVARFSQFWFGDIYFLAGFA